MKAVRASLVFAFAVAAMACQATLSIDGRPCPCTDGYTCCESSQTCVANGGFCASSEGGSANDAAPGDRDGALGTGDAGDSGTPTDGGSDGDAATVPLGVLSRVDDEPAGANCAK